MNGLILTLNAGSSSLKFALFEDSESLTQTMRGEIENLTDAPHFRAYAMDGTMLAEHACAANSFAETLSTLLTFSGNHLGSGGLTAIGHRIVHGGAKHVAPAFITPQLLISLEALTPLDPLHMPPSLAPVHAIAATHPALPQIACFDTAFHHTLPLVAQQFALPRAISATGVRRYGFHGLSYEYIAGQLQTQLPDLAAGRVIAAHLGAGASLCALRNGASIATTTGFSALDGLVMATRCGRLDPGVLLYLAAQGHSQANIEHMLYHQSGLLGVSGISGDIRVLLASDDPHAKEAIELFTYHIACEVGALTSALGGLDGLVFTAGIGEHAASIRAGVCARLAWLGIRLDVTANAANAQRISTPDSRVAVHVIPTNEEVMIARHTQSTYRAHAHRIHSLQEPAS
jgi:acetate kinase